MYKIKGNKMMSRDGFKDPLPRCGEILPPIINVTPTCSEAFYNNNNIIV